MEVNVQLLGVDDAVKRLRGIPGGARLALQWSIISALRKGRTAAAKAARERYIIPYGWLLKSIGRPRISALTGYLHVSGTKAPLSMFKPKDIYPGGISFQELKEGPSIIRHAFTHGGPILERETKETRRYPLRTLFGLSAPQMIGQKTEVFPKLQQSLQKDVDIELQRLIKALLAGQIVPKI